MILIWDLCASKVDILNIDIIIKNSTISHW